MKTTKPRDKATRAEKMAAYTRGHAAGEIAIRDGSSAVAEPREYGRSTSGLSAAWNDGYHDALEGLFAPEEQKAD